MHEMESNPARLQSEWEELCEHLRGFAADMVLRRAYAEPAQMIREEVDRFCGQPVPACNDDLLQRWRMKSELAGTLSAIAHADSMAYLHPEQADAIFSEARRCLEPTANPVDVPVAPRNWRWAALTFKVTQLCGLSGHESFTVGEQPG